MELRIGKTVGLSGTGARASAGTRGGSTCPWEAVEDSRGKGQPSV